MKQLKSGIKRAINWNKDQSKTNRSRAKQIFLLLNRSFQGVNKLFVLSFENWTDRIVHSGYYTPKIEIKDCNVIIDGKNLLDQPVKNDLETYHNIGKFATSQGDDYITGCLLDYPYFKKHYKVIAIDLSQQQNLDADTRSVQEIKFTGNLENKCTNIFHY